MSKRRPIIVLAVAGLVASSGLSQRGPEPEEPREIGLNDLFALCRPEVVTTVDPAVRDPAVRDPAVLYQTLGILRRTAELDKQGRFALVHPVAACCARGIAVGLCVRTDRVTTFEDGARVIVQGRLRPADPPPALPRGHMAQIDLGILRKHVEIVASQTVIYDRLEDASLSDLGTRLNAPEYATFFRALRATGWESTLRQPSYFTVLAPTEHAFRKLSAADRDALFAPANAKGLAALVRRHIAASWNTRHSLMAQSGLKTLGHEGIPVELVNGRLRIGGARVLFQETAARNGVVMALDRMLPAPTTKESSEPRK